jgi:3-methyladenine DNA glycosylase AlkC
MAEQNGRKNKNTLSTRRMTPFKELINKESLSLLANEIKNINSAFDSASFQRDCLLGLKKMELKNRIVHVARCLSKYLIFSYPKNLKIIEKALQQNKLHGFIAWPLTEYVRINGDKDPTKSLAALETITPYFSSEFAIRKFIREYNTLSMQQIQQWANHPSEHVRRLASEGSRPRLPWGEKLDIYIQNPDVLFDLLEKLIFDESAYVRKSVANNLNDISKDHPDKLLKKLKAWQKKAHTPQQKVYLEWIGRHACRSLFKAGHPQALALYGYRQISDIHVKQFKLSASKIQIGQNLNFKFNVSHSGKKQQKLMIDYIIHYQKSQDRLSKKVFKLKKIVLKPKISVPIIKTHSFVDRSIRKHHKGEHLLEIQINGQVVARKVFSLS